MSALLIAGLVVCWLLFAAFAYASGFAVLQRKFPEIAQSNYRRDRIVCAIYGLLGGPIAFLTIAFTTDIDHPIKNSFKYGLKWR